MELDQKGTELYETYRRARREWAAYIVPKACKAFSERLTAEGRHHYYEMLYKDLSKDVSASDADDRVDDASDPDDAEVKALYKKLALVFHPDKYNGSDAFFKIIHRYAKEGNLKCLKAISVLAQSFSKEVLTLERVNELVEIMNSPERLERLGRLEGQERKTDDDQIVQDDDDILDRCTAYHWYIGSHKTRKIYENLYYTDNQLLKRLRQSSSIEKLDFYINCCQGKEDKEQFLKELLIIKIGKIHDEQVRMKAQTDRIRTETAEIKARTAEMEAEIGSKIAQLAA
jgi:hypothetical protein